jgi:hypothetical protein
MNWFSAKQNLFEKYPDISITADAFEPKYIIKYTECKKERGSVRFERKEKIVPRQMLENLISDILENG